MNLGAPQLHQPQQQHGQAAVAYPPQYAQQAQQQAQQQTQQQNQQQNQRGILGDSLKQAFLQYAIHESFNRERLGARRHSAFLCDDTTIPALSWPCGVATSWRWRMGRAGVVAGEQKQMCGFRLRKKKTLFFHRFDISLSARNLFMILFVVLCVILSVFSFRLCPSSCPLSCP
jgi:hypothetical protein